MARASRGSDQLQANVPARESRATKARLAKPGQQKHRLVGADNVPHEASEVAACRASGAFSIEHGSALVAQAAREAGEASREMLAALAHGDVSLSVDEFQRLPLKKAGGRVAYEPGDVVSYRPEACTTEPRYLSIAQVARMLSVDGHVVSPDSVRVWIRVGTTAKGSHRKKVQPVKLRATVLPHGRVVAREDLAAFLAELTARYEVLSPRRDLLAVVRAGDVGGLVHGVGVGEIGEAVYPEPRGRKGGAWAS